MAREERSAGVVVYREGPAGRLYLLLDYGKHWDFPKGHVEKIETDMDAARRELREETGIRDSRIVEGFARLIEYYFHHPRRGLIHKQVVFFLGRTDQEQVRLSEEHRDYEWMPCEEALRRLTYATARDVLRAAEEWLRGGGLSTISPHPSPLPRGEGEGPHPGPVPAGEGKGPTTEPEGI